MLKALGYREHIQRKAKAGQPLSECQKGRNKRIAKLVELKFAEFTGFAASIQPLPPTRRSRRIVLLPMMPGARASGMKRQCWPTIQPVRPGRWSIQCKQSLMPRKGPGAKS
jgi:hypothetical protein